MHSNTVRYIRNLFRSNGNIPLHAPRFVGNEKNYLADCIASAEVSAEGEYVSRFESMVCDYSGARYAVAFNSSESALRVALTLAGTAQGCEVLTQPLAHAGTANSISGCGAVPIFIDVERKQMGMDPARLKEFLAYNAEVRDDGCYNRHTQRRITACVPIHTLGIACRIDEIKAICEEYNIVLIEGANDALGSRYKGKMLGRFGTMAVYGFEGHKIVTCGDGGVLVCDDEALARQARKVGDTPFLSAAPGKVPGRLCGRMPSLNAAVGCAQMEHLRTIVTKQRDLTRRYKEFFEESDHEVFRIKKDNEPNCWLTALFFEEKEERNRFLTETNAESVNTRALWPIVSDLEPYRNAPKTDLANTHWLHDRIALLPSGVR